MPRSRLYPVFVALFVGTAGLHAAAAQTQDAGAYLAARVAVQDGDYRAAAEWYDRALIVDGENRQLLDGLIAARMGLGDISLAEAAAKKLVSLGGKSQISDFALLAAQAGREDYEGILKAQADGRRLGDLLDRLVAAWAQIGAGRMSDALKEFDAIAAKPGMEAFGLYHKALALGLAGDFEGADAILSGKAAGPIQLTRTGVFAHAQILSQLERNADALALLDSRLGKEPDPVADALRARLAAGEPVPFDSVRSAKDGLAEVFFTMANALSGEAALGYTYLHSRIAMYLNPRHDDAILLSAGLLESQGQYDFAAETFALIAKDNLAYPIAEIGRADSLFRADRKDDAVAALQALAKTHGGYFIVQSSLGDAYRRTERFAECVTAYDAAEALVPKIEARHWALFYSRGVCYERQSLWVPAETDLRKALELNPDQPQVLNYLGYSFVDRGVNLDEALGMIERAVKAEPESGYIVDSLAWALFRMGRYKEALAPMERASLLEPVDPVVTDHLGDVYWAVGRVREAEFQWRRALSLDPTEKDAARIRQKLELGLDAVMAQEGQKPLDGNDAAAVDN
ncbi:MAG: tetratricopeptide repeat protein [Pseudomonadota bacterium]